MLSLNCLPGNFKAFHIITVLSTLQLAKYWSFEDQAKSKTSLFKID